MPNHLEKARNNWDAVLTVPTELRGVNGLPSLRFRKSTGTPDKRKACTIASQLVAGWKLLIEQAKGNDTTALNRAIQWSEELKNTKDLKQRGVIESLITDEALALAYPRGEDDEDVNMGLVAQGKEFYQVATGIKTPHSLHFDNWKKQLTVTPRTIEQYSKDTKLFIEQFPIIEDVSKKEVSLWLDGLSAKGVTKDTQRRIIKGCRNYWKYLSRYNIKGMTDDPFYQVVIADKGKKKAPREPFEPHEIVELWSMAKDRQEDVLADLITLGAYTGARIDELCSLMVKDVAEDLFNIIDSKTSAGVRAVPIHSHIKLVIKRLKDNAKDGYLLPNLTLDKFGDRSSTMSSRFSKLKIKAGHSRLKVFHSLRHTFITALVNAGVMEFHIADIVGHEKKGITGNVYAKAISVEVKRKAIEKVSYPFPELS
ncbi:MAG: tyrosine-type recombinase/integrase [Methylotenera sp.]